MQLAPDVIKASIEIAEDLSYFAPPPRGKVSHHRRGMLCDRPRQYVVVEGYKLGALTIHDFPGEDRHTMDRHRVSHGETGILVCDCPNLTAAIELARVADKAIDWSLIRRSESIGIAIGWTPALAATLENAIKSLPRLPTETPEWGFARG